MNCVFLLAVSLQYEVIVLVVSDFHGFEGVSVVCVLECEHLGSFQIAAVDEILQCHFQADLYGNASGIRKKTVIQISGQPFRELVG